MIRASCDGCRRPATRQFDGGETEAPDRACGAFVVCLCEGCASDFRRGIWALVARATVGRGRIPLPVTSGDPPWALCSWPGGCLAAAVASGRCERHAPS